MREGGEAQGQPWDGGSSPTGALLTSECLDPRRVPCEKKSQSLSGTNSPSEVLLHFLLPGPTSTPPCHLATGRDRGVVFSSLLPAGRCTHQGSPPHAGRATSALPSGPRHQPSRWVQKPWRGGVPVCSPTSSNLSLKFLYVNPPTPIPMVIFPILKTHS